MAQHAKNISSSVVPTCLNNVDGGEHVASLWQQYEHLKAQDIFKNALLEASQFYFFLVMIIVRVNPLESVCKDAYRAVAQDD